MTGVIICGGNIENYDYIKKYLRDVDLIISADSGARHCEGLGVIPDILVGDFDSVRGEDFDRLVSAGSEVIRFPAEKDMTDSEIAIEFALEKGCSCIILLGASGSRLDHSVSNLMLLKKLTDLDVEGILADEKNEIRLIMSQINLIREEGVFVTLLPVAGKACGVTTSGLYYPLEDAVLEIGSSWGVSNRFSEEYANISVKNGYLMVFKSRD